VVHVCAFGWVQGAVMRDEQWVLKGCQALEGDFYIVERFDNEADCRKEMELMKREHPSHLFWCEVYESRPRDLNWVGD